VHLQGRALAGHGTTDRAAGMVPRPPRGLGQAIQQPRFLRLRGHLDARAYFLVISRRAAIDNSLRMGPGNTNHDADILS